MRDAPRVGGLIAALAAGLLSACSVSRYFLAPRPGPSGDLLVLLPDPEDGAVGRATVSTPAGTVELAKPRDSTRTFLNLPPAPVTVMSETDVQRLFGCALSTLPSQPRHFTLSFLQSDELTAEDRALVPRIVEAVRSLPAPDVLVVGHTDTTGTAADNYQLGLRRANVARNLLLEVGLDPSIIEVASHGKADLLIPTADETPEPRNRRVEIIVR
jgi:outer membrane protein OmpA-like peptidoglycan-associated protein